MSMLSKNIAHIESFKHFVFVFVSEYLSFCMSLPWPDDELFRKYIKVTIGRILNESAKWAKINKMPTKNPGFNKNSQIKSFSEAEDLPTPSIYPA